ncbi:WGR domain-containing protein [Micromonospora sp. BRA006-A]|nr:WGR domain-containing protein [Micromonospora sp. BRA006-A]
MRRFEFVGGGSAKFWEVGQSDATVTVRYGSIGAQGRTQVKELGSPAEAAAHADRLIAEKLRKGYAEATVAPSAGHTGTPAVEPAASSRGPETAGSDPAAAGSAGSVLAGRRRPHRKPASCRTRTRSRFRPPGGGCWSRAGAAHPARACRAPRRAVPPAARCWTRWPHRSPPPHGHRRSGAGPELRGYLDGQPGPLGGAALVAAVAVALGYHARDQQGVALADLLAADLGPAGAAVAATEQITVAATGSASPLSLGRAEVNKAHNYGHWRLRQGCYAGSARTRGGPRGRLRSGPRRPGPVPVRAAGGAGGHLVPAADRAGVGGPGRRRRGARGGPLLAELLLGAVDDVDAIHNLAGHLQVYRLMYDQAPIVTVTAAVGPPIAPVLAGWFDDEHVGADAQAAARVAAGRPAR